MIDVISVQPLAEGWAVRHPRVANPQIFLSGAKAEDAAIRLGSRLADAGQPTEVVVYLRGGAMGGRVIYSARPEGGVEARTQVG
jgi:hypothetical protein